MIKTGYCKWEFEDYFPYELNGIISRNEFHDSISNINKKISRKPRIICIVGMLVCIIGGFMMFILTPIKIPGFKPPELISAGCGFALFGFGIFCPIFGFCILNKILAYRLRPVVANESKKYADRLPASCIWQIESITVRRGYGRNSRPEVLLFICIDIYRPTNGSVVDQYPQPITTPPSYTSSSV